MVPAGNKVKRLSSINHTIKTIHHHHYHHHRFDNNNNLSDTNAEKNKREGEKIAN